MSVFFISDLHLQESRPELTKAFINFLAEKINSEDELYILGDFFEQWIGDDHENQFINLIKKNLREKTTSGSKIYFMHGNRDFLIGKKFCNDVHSILLDDPHELEISKKRILLMHGDSLCTDDKDYQEFRSLVRNKNWQEEFLSKDLNERMEVAKSLREVSKLENKSKDEAIMDVNNLEVLKTIEENSLDLLIHGHTHRPFVHDENGVPRMVLGDWGSHLWYIKSTDGEFELMKEKI